MQKGSRSTPLIFFISSFSRFAQEFNNRLHHIVSWKFSNCQLLSIIYSQRSSFATATPLFIHYYREFRYMLWYRDYKNLDFITRQCGSQLSGRVMWPVSQYRLISYQVFHVIWKKLVELRHGPFQFTRLFYLAIWVWLFGVFVQKFLKFVEIFTTFSIWTSRFQTSEGSTVLQSYLFMVWMGDGHNES